MMTRSGAVYCGLGVAIWLLLIPLAASAAVELTETGQPNSYVLGFAPADLRGFGGVTFGMSADDVMAVLEATYPEAEIERTLEPILQTEMIHLRVSGLAPVPGMPSPGPATVTYVFGYQSQRLTAINLHWYAEGDATQAQREAMLAGGTAYVGHLLGFYWEPLSTSRGVVIGPNTVILFAGRDQSGRGVDVIVEGVPLDVLVLPGGQMEHRPIENGPAHLSIRLSAQPDNPDVFTIPAGSF